MKNKNLFIIGAVVLAAFFFFKKKKTVTPPPPPVPLLPVDNNLHPVDMLPKGPIYPGGLTEGMRVMADNDLTQLILLDGKKYGLTFEQWGSRGYDAYTTINSNILDQVPYGGTYNAGI
jgi:hypothetical protein